MSKSIGTGSRKVVRLLGICVLLYSLLFSSFPVLADATYNWGQVPIGGGGYITGIINAPSNSSIYYARTDVGGCYRWDNTNSKWIQLMDKTSYTDRNLMGIDGICVAPNNENTLYVAAGGWRNSGTSDVLKSTDGGSTWSRTYLDLAVGGNWAGFAGAESGTDCSSRATGECIIVDPGNTNIVLVGTPSNGVWRSTNGGGSWTQISATLNYARCFVASSSVIYMGVPNSGIYKSTDHGATFTQISSSITTPARMALSGTSLYVAYEAYDDPQTVKDRCIYKYNGTTWTKLKVATADGGGIGAVTADTNNANVVVAAQTSDWRETGIYRSTDGGNSWTKISSGYDPARNIYKRIKEPGLFWDVYGTAPNSQGADFCWGTSTLALNPSNNKKMFFGDMFGIWYTPDITAGSNVEWDTRVKGVEEIYCFDLACPPSGVPLYSAVADCAGFKHNAFSQFTDTTRLPVNQSAAQSIDFCQNNPNYMAMVCADNWQYSDYNTYLSTDAGNNWTPIISDPAYKNGKIAYSGTNINNMVYVAGEGDCYPRYTLDMGATWHDCVGLPKYTIGGFWKWNVPLAADRVNGKKFYFYSAQYNNGSPVANFYRSINNGANWTIVNTSLPALDQSIQYEKVGSTSFDGDDYWSDYWSLNNSYRIQTDYYYNGWDTNCARINNGEGWALQTITNLVPNTTYKATAWVKTDSSSHSAVFLVKNYGNTQVDVSTNSTGYQKLSLEFTTGPTNTSAQISVYKNFSGYAYCDEFDVREKGYDGNFGSDALIQIKAAPNVEGLVWASIQTKGLYRSTNSGTSFTKISFFQDSRLVAIGRGTSPEVFVYGKNSNLWGVFRSIDSGNTWTKLANSDFCENVCMAVDQQVEGRVFIGTGGRGIVYGTANNLVVNPGFEADGGITQTPSGWNERSNSGYEDCSSVESGGRSGAYRLAHWGDTSYNVSTYQSFNSLPSGNYTLTAWVQSSGGQNSATMSAKKSDGSQVSVSLPQTSGKWVRVTLSNISITDGFCEISFNSDAYANQWIRVDDVEFFKQ